MTPFSRRNFLERSSLAALGLFLPSFARGSLPRSIRQEAAPLEIHIFSKHLQFLDYSDLAAAVKDIGFAGADLTVRPGGHVEPERVEEQLPKAIEALQDAGLKTKMMTTAITDANDTLSRKVLETAARHGIEQYRMGYFRYPGKVPIPTALQIFQSKMAELAQFNQELGLQGAYQNHAGTYVGASIWEIWELVKNAGDGVGCQYDIRHATVEGGRSWPIGLRLIQPWITNIVLKDFKWEQANDQWRIINTPIGEGMVDFKQYFKLLKSYDIQVPASMHLEYNLGGAEHGSNEIATSPTTVFAAMQKDLTTVQRLWQEA
ncbi:MAG: TIM barrel protein [Saprospiraceae bacterium]|nr:TIM barrel protein [Saprospiraceae bacterium]